MQDPGGTHVCTLEAPLPTLPACMGNIPYRTLPRTPLLPIHSPPITAGRGSPLVKEDLRMVSADRAATIVVMQPPESSAATTLQAAQNQVRPSGLGGGTSLKPLNGDGV